jgi:hypothetical protein
MRHHRLLKSKVLIDLSKGECTKIVDVAGITTRIFILPRGPCVRKIASGYF